MEPSPEKKEEQENKEKFIKEELESPERNENETYKELIDQPELGNEPAEENVVAEANTPQEEVEQVIQESAVSWAQEIELINSQLDDLAANLESELDGYKVSKEQKTVQADIQRTERYYISPAKESPSRETKFADINSLPLDGELQRKSFEKKEYPIQTTLYAEVKPLPGINVGIKPPVKEPLRNYEYHYKGKKEEPEYTGYVKALDRSKEPIVQEKVTLPTTTYLKTRAEDYPKTGSVAAKLGYTKPADTYVAPTTILTGSYSYKPGNFVPTEKFAKYAPK